MMKSERIVSPGLFGFSVAGGAGRRMAVELVPWCFRVFRKDAAPVDAGLYDTQALTELACGALSRRRIRIRRQEFEPLCKQLRAECDRIVAIVPSEVRMVQQRVFEETEIATGLHVGDAFYGRRFLVSDVLRFRAAAIAVGYADKLCTSTSPNGKEPDSKLDRLENWMGLFSPDGRPYKSLRRTLMNLAAELPSLALLGLPSLTLPRAVSDPDELLALCALGSLRQSCENKELWMNRFQIFASATAKELDSVHARYLEEAEMPSQAKSLASLRRLANYLLDFPEIHTGRLNGLMEKASRWHYDAANGTVEEMLEWVNLPCELRRLDALLPPPPFGMPVDSRIQFLDTVGAVLEEGRSMRHCVGSLVGNAARGRSFFFHVEYQGKRATVELDSHGRFVQASGPRNSENEAVLWGARELEECARIGRQRRFRRKADAARACKPFDRLRRRLSGYEWFEIAERLHERARDSRKPNELGADQVHVPAVGEATYNRKDDGPESRHEP